MPAFKSIVYIKGDMLWQPVNKAGPVEMRLSFRIPTLMELRELPAFMNKGGQVLLVMGSSGITLTPKSKLLRVLLEHPQQLFNNLVTDTPTVRGLFELLVRPDQD